ncbi:Quinone oxidoreductase 2 [compost metagenome]
MTQEQFASAIGDVLGKDVPVQQVDDEAYADIMKGAGVPDFLIPFLVGIQQGIREGGLEIESNDFDKLLGRPATPVREALTQIVSGISNPQ